MADTLQKFITNFKKCNVQIINYLLVFPQMKYFLNTIFFLKL